MKTVIVFDGIQIIAAIVAVIGGLFLLFIFLLDAHYRRHPNGRFKKFWYKVLGVDKKYW